MKGARVSSVCVSSVFSCVRMSLKRQIAGATTPYKLIMSPDVSRPYRASVFKSQCHHLCRPTAFYPL